MWNGAGASLGFTMGMRAEHKGVGPKSSLYKLYSTAKTVYRL